MNSLLRIPPLSLYVHLPWCLAKCPYCDFNSHPVRGSVPEQRYLRALARDLDEAADQAAGRALTSVFFGGGTPSLFRPDSIARILETICSRIALPATAEITLEANPGTLEHGRFAEYRAAGINRLSIGVQSFNRRHLAALGRIHGPAQAVAAIEEAHAAGFDNFNVDLMYALPEQTPEEAIEDVETAISLEPSHLSYYQLTLEPNTLFHAQPPAAMPDDECAWQMQEGALPLLRGAGFVQYETSAFARCGLGSAHNLNYWNYGDYIGIGAGAHGKVTLPERNLILRYARFRHPETYMGKPEGRASIEKSWTVDPDERPFEFFLNAFRLTVGTTAAAFSAATGLPADRIEAQLAAARQQGLLEGDGSHWRPTPLGRNHLNQLQTLFLPEAGDIGGGSPPPPTRAAADAAAPE